MEQTRPWAFALLSMVLGSGALAIGLAQPAGPNTGRLFITTIGVTAYFFGREACRRTRWNQKATRFFSRTGQVFGAVGTILMAYAILAAVLAPSITLPSFSIAPHGTGLITSSAADVPAAPSAPAVHSAVPAPAQVVPTVAPQAPSAWVPTTADAELSAVEQAAGTLADVMKQDFGAGPYPASLETVSSSPERIALTTGTPLAAAPNGARVIYSRSSDGMAWGVQIIGASFGQEASYDSVSGVVQ